MLGGAITLLCYLRRQGYKTCKGKLDRAHLIPKQRIKHAGITDEDVIWDKRVWTWVCRAHHHSLDMKFIHLTYEQYPDTLKEWADEHGFYWVDQESGWHKEHG